MLNGSAQLEAWKKIAAFEVFGDYAPMSGFRLMVKISVQSSTLDRVLESRAQSTDLLDPELARYIVRAGLGLSQSGMVSFVYATPAETVCIIRPDVVQGAGAAVPIQSQLQAAFTARLSLLAGAEVPAVGQLFEFPDATVVRKALTKLVEDVEESTPLRSSLWLGAQLRGRGQPFHPSMLETLEEQTSLLQSNGIDMDALPPWWWRGVAATVRPDGGVDIYDDLPVGEAIGQLVPE
ncbi:MAG: hypothetical protein AAGA54_03385 [Myxococcota bacterium]